MSPRSGPLVILGIGNILLSDDAAGVHAVQLLESDPTLPQGTIVVDGGTGGLSLLPIISDAGALILVDAIDVGAQPGHIQVLAGADLHADPARLSVHEVGTSDLLAAARLTGVLPTRTVLVGIQPGSLDTSLELSPAVAAAMGLLVATVRHWCETLLAADADTEPHLPTPLGVAGS